MTSLVLKKSRKQLEAKHDKAAGLDNVTNI